MMLSSRGLPLCRLALAVAVLAGCGAAGPALAGPQSSHAGHSAGTSPSPAGQQTAAGPAAGPPAAVTAGFTGPAPSHTVIVVMENHSYGEIIGNPAAPFVNHLARRGALFTHSYGITHPSEPNYLALLSGSTQGVTDDSCPHSFARPNLAADLLAAGRRFTGYSEGLPSAGSLTCSAGGYARKHVPWTNFSNVPGSANQPLTSYPARDLARLPAVSFVIPDLCHDMHDCAVAVGDAWLRSHLARYASWAMTHHSLLILTWDEDDHSQSNQVPTIFAGQMIRPGRYGQRITHYNVLRTVEDAYRLRHDGQAATAQPITGIWKN